MGLGTGGRTITKVSAGVIKDGTITASKFAASGTASASTVLFGNMTWAAGAASGKRDFTDTNASATAGDVWFESSNLRFAIDPNAAIGSWVTGGTMNTARKDLTGFGVQTAGVSAGGNTPSTSSVTEVYNGSTWIATSNLLGGHDIAGSCGNLGAGLLFGGYSGGNLSTTEEFDGLSWTAGGAIASGVRSPGGAGTQTAGLVIGGEDGPNISRCQEYNGTAWTTVNSLLAAVSRNAGLGKQTAAMSVGGGSPYPTATEEYNGTSWSAGGNLSNGRDCESSGMGSQTAGAIAGGQDGAELDTTEEYNGTAWSAGGNLLADRPRGACCGSQSAGLSFGGLTGSTYLATSEEYHKPQITWSAV